MVPRDEVHELNMSIPDAMKLIISGGAVVPPWTYQEAGSIDLIKPTPSLERPQDD